jgi:hypothetical protein
VSQQGPLFDPVPFYGAPMLALSATPFDDLVQRYGVPCTIRRAMPCPCAYGDTGQARASCTSCNGLGFAYDPQLRLEKVKCIVQGRTRTGKVAPPGVTFDDTVQITFPSGVVVAMGDQVWPEGETVEHEELVRRSVVEVDDAALRYRSLDYDAVAAPSTSGADRILYPDVTSIIAVSYYAENRAVLAVEGVDYERVANTFRWLRGGPAPGDHFSVRFRAPAAYQIVTAPPPTRAFLGQSEPLPTKGSAIALHKMSAKDLR